MLDSRLRKQIEWHFFNYNADKKLSEEAASQIAESGVTVEYGGSGIRSRSIGRPTESKALRICDNIKSGEWSKVVENTFTAFRFEPEYDIMQKVYIDRIKYKDLFADGFNESTYWYWRDRWLGCAYMWAIEYGLL